MSIYSNEKLADVFKALANPHRLTIFKRLMSCCGDCVCVTDDMKLCVGDLGAEMDIAQSTLSHHLKELKQVGLIHMQRRGKNIDCWINQDILGELTSYFTAS